MASSRKRILFVDDEENIRIIVQATLEYVQGWEILLATSAEQGLAIAETAQPDAILLDGMMPEVDGATFLQQLQANPAIQSIPVVFLTAKLSLTEPRRYRELGARGAIAKPFDPLTLAAQITQILGWS